MSTEARFTDEIEQRDKLSSQSHALHIPRFGHSPSIYLWLRHLGKRLLTPALLLLIFFVVILGWAWNTTPSTAHLETWVQVQTARYRTSYTPLAHISPLVQEALIAIEDERFYQHHGIDVLGISRAAWSDLRAGRFVQGGSTLTAQLAKNAYLHDYDHTIPLKLEDLLLAVKIEQHYSKSEILEMYLNLVFYGEGAHGIAAASARYFGVSPAQLTLSEAAMLAGLVQAPGAYDPWCFPAAAYARQHIVLDHMVADGYITHAQAQAAERGGLSLRPVPRDLYCGT